MITKLPRGTTYFINECGERVVTGSQMGRRSESTDKPIKFFMRRLKWVDGDYDEQGAYWGYVSGTHIYHAQGETDTDIVDHFVRATDRADAKAQVLAACPNAKFYR